MVPSLAVWKLAHCTPIIMNLSLQLLLNTRGACKDGARVARMRASFGNCTGREWLYSYGALGGGHARVGDLESNNGRSIPVIKTAEHAGALWGDHDGKLDVVSLEKNIKSV